MNKISIKSINWNNIYLNIEFNKKIDSDLYLIKDEKKYKICDEYIDNNILKMPITCAYRDNMIEEGIWNFCYNDELVKIDIDCVKELESKQKVFFYKGHLFAVIVSFNIDEEFNLILHMDYMKKNKKPYKNERVADGNYIKKAVINIGSCFVMLLYSFLCIIHRKKGNKILFMSETRDKLSGNLLALSNRMKERNLDTEYKMYYSFKKVLSDKKSILYILKIINLISKVDYIFVDDYAPIFNTITLKKTKLIQLWHAGVGFKSVGYSRFGKDGSPHPTISVHRKYDYAVVAAPNLIPVYQEVFGLTKKHFLAPGMLRLDGYLDKETIASAKKKIYELYPKIKNKKVILFAPTYRGTGQKNAYYDFDKIDISKLYLNCNKNNYVVLFKFHPFIKEKIDIDEKYKDILIDASDYPDINELFYVVDILITDYSSNIYEFSIFERPIIYFDYDLEVYNVLRGVHNSLEDSPGNVCKTFDEVLSLLDSKKFNIEKIKKFKNDNILIQDTKACDNLIKMIFKK